MSTEANVWRKQNGMVKQQNKEDSRHTVFERQFPINNSMALELRNVQGNKNVHHNLIARVLPQSACDNMLQLSLWRDILRYSIR